jgi:uncharacterized cupredoxin-like copper-binding protein
MRRVRQSSIVAVVALAVGMLVLGACGGDDDSGDSTAPEGKTVTATNGQVTVVGVDVAFEETTINAEPGPLEVTLQNDGAQQHSFRIDKPEEFRIQASPGDEASGSTVDLPAGTYQYYCDIPGHRATMHGQLVVR